MNWTQVRKNEKHLPPSCSVQCLHYTICQVQWCCTIADTTCIPATWKFSKKMHGSSIWCSSCHSWQMSSFTEGVARCTHDDRGGPVVFGSYKWGMQLSPGALQYHLWYQQVMLGHELVTFFLFFTYRQLDYHWLTCSHKRNSLNSHNLTTSWSSQGTLLRQYSTCCGQHRCCTSFCEQTSFCFLPLGACYNIAM